MFVLPAFSFTVWAKFGERSLDIVLLSIDAAAFFLTSVNQIAFTHVHLLLLLTSLSLRRFGPYAIDKLVTAVCVTRIFVYSISTNNVKIQGWVTGQFFSFLTLFLLCSFVYCDVSQWRKYPVIAELTVPWSLWAYLELNPFNVAAYIPGRRTLYMGTAFYCRVL
jgi:hypothetical protein